LKKFDNSTEGESYPCFSTCAVCSSLTHKIRTILTKPKRSRNRSDVGSRTWGFMRRPR
jgi:hypothetical protein